MIGVAISGKICAGKTTAAQVLVEELGFTKVALADELKRVAARITEWVGTTFDPGPVLTSTFLGIRDRAFLQSIVSRMNNKATPEGRAWLQWLGTDCLRSVVPDIWVEALLDKIRRKGYERVVVDDVRFVDEANALRDQRFLMVRIEVPTAVQAERVERLYPNYDQSTFHHASETVLDNYGFWDHTIDGSLPLDQFKRDILYIGRDWLARARSIVWAVATIAEVP